MCVCVCVTGERPKHRLFIGFELCVTEFRYATPPRSGFWGGERGSGGVFFVLAGEGGGRRGALCCPRAVQRTCLDGFWINIFHLHAFDLSG